MYCQRGTGEPDAERYSLLCHEDEFTTDEATSGFTETEDVRAEEGVVLPNPHETLKEFPK